MKSLAIVDYGIGNLKSVANAVGYLGGRAELVADPQRLGDYQSLLLPGVGSFRRAMQRIEAMGLDSTIRELVLERAVPVLGICLGMQLLGRHSSEDGETAGLGLLDCEVGRFEFDRERHPTIKVPHVGFNTVVPASGSRLFAGLGERADFYFTHSYRVPRLAAGNCLAAECWHGEPFTAAIEHGHIAATQFHPEKSQANGLKLLQNFLELF